ncbi:MAG: hypothetical protein IT429_07800 [Gemmataceae bacterium]|nr:hypothetical protein [Gemmataceae bacterium]
MRNIWGWLGTFLLIAAGCRSVPPELKPPPQPEDYSLPPQSDVRYNQPYKPPRDPNEAATGRRPTLPGPYTTPGMMPTPTRNPRMGGMGGLSPGMY